MKKVKLDKLGKIITGNTPSKKILEFYDSNDIPFIKPDDFKTIDEISSSKGNKNYISENARNNARIVPQNSVLVTCIGVIGKVMISESELSFNQQINAIVPNELILSKYLAYLLLYNKSNLDFISNAPVVPIINKTQFSEFEVTFHENIDVQEMIIQKLENLDNQILKRRHQSKLLSNLVKSRFNEMFGDVILNDKEWKISKWNEILTIRNGKNQKNVEDKNGQFPIYGSGGIIGYAKDWIVKKNSVIIGRKGNINKPILVRENFWNVDTAFGLEPTLEKINSEYLFYFCQLYNFEKLNKAVTIPSLTKSDLLDISLPLPPLSLQNEFADFVAQVDKSQFACQIVIKLWRNSLKSSII